MTIRTAILICLLPAFPFFSQAATLQGTDTVAMQGMHSTVLPSAGSDEFSHDFSSLTGWAIAGDFFVSADQGVATVSNGGGDSGRSPDLTLRNEYWVQFTFAVQSAGFVMASTNTIQGSGLATSTGSNRLMLGIKKNSTNQVWYARWMEDGGEQSTFSTGIEEMQLDTVYTIVMHYKSASAPGANNGIAQIWSIHPAQTVQTVLDLKNVDSDTVADLQAFLAGNKSATAGVDAIIKIDDLIMGTSGQEYVP